MSTTTMTVSTAPGAFARLAGAVGTVALRLAEFARAYKNRRDLDLVATLDDRMLADIGLTRGDVRDAIAQPLWRDPSHVLVTRACERRHFRRAASSRSGRPITSPSLIPDLGIPRTPARYY